jgi:Leucine-rich repeat (LRR) protein
MRSHAKRRRGTAALTLTSIPVDVFRAVVAFAAPTLVDVTTLAVVSRYFRTLMSSPQMAFHVRPNFTAVWDRLDRLGPLVQGVRAAHAQTVTNLRMLSCMPRLRVLELPYGEFCSSVFNAAMAHVPHLHMLNVNCCQNLSVISNLPSGLRILKASSCTNLRHLPDMLPNVYHLNVTYCSQLRALPQMPEIEVLNMINCSAKLSTPSTVRHLKKQLASDDIESISKSTKLEILDLTDCNVNDINFVFKLKSLVTLSLDFVGRDIMIDMTALATMQNLKDLRLENEVTDDHLAIIGRLSSLFSLTLMSHLITDDGVREIGKIKGLVYLTLDNYDCLGITATGLGFCAGLTGLHTLTLKYCIGVEDLGAVADIPGLRALSFVGCSSITNLSALGKLTSLHTLEFDSCDSVTTLTGLNSIPKLETLTVLCCHNLSRGGIWALLPCQSLKTLKMCEHTCELLVEGDLEPFDTHNIALQFI